MERVSQPEGPQEIWALRSPLYGWHSINNGKAKRITAKLLGIRSSASEPWLECQESPGEVGSEPQDGRRMGLGNGVKAFALEEDSRGCGSPADKL